MEGQEKEQGELFEELKSSRQKSRSQPSGLDRVKSLTRKLSAKSRFLIGHHEKDAHNHHFTPSQFFSEYVSKKCSKAVRVKDQTAGKNSVLVAEPRSSTPSPFAVAHFTSGDS
ncbi:hypothetical protein ANCCEY_09815 [Ancylostoma ceylanicum]|uniref:Uncharacterized protein n=1 Tax=Ancylostoma ceylanicum TaxID=53326 RepID=A0A0D6LM27_9BILA|nr:hypothetical protein ANCCEY_09815 [Ancylostoma ceylanicum]